MGKMMLCTLGIHTFRLRNLAHLAVFWHQMRLRRNPNQRRRFNRLRRHSRWLFPSTLHRCQGLLLLVSVNDLMQTSPNLLFYHVTSPYGNNLYYKENTTHGNFAFTTQETGNYLACFWIDPHYQGAKEVSVSLDWKTGIAAKDWESVARKEKIEGVELELRKLEGAVEAIHENLLYLKGREAEMRAVSERTNARVAWFSIMSLGICIGVSGLQLWHLKRFFQKKKLI
ncbi:hypothetical protein HN51_037946 [Arachis hypogaea]